MNEITKYYQVFDLREYKGMNAGWNPIKTSCYFHTKEGDDICLFNSRESLSSLKIKLDNLSVKQFATRYLDLMESIEKSIKHNWAVAGEETTIYFPFNHNFDIPRYILKSFIDLERPLSKEIEKLRIMEGLE